MNAESDKYVLLVHGPRFNIFVVLWWFCWFCWFCLLVVVSTHENRSHMLPPLVLISFKMLKVS